MAFRPDHPPKPPFEQDPRVLIERFIERELTESYKGVVMALNKTGLWEPLLDHPDNLGITGIDDKEYPLPTVEGIATELRAHPDIYGQKLAAGFGSIVPVPIAAPLDHLTRILRNRILAHHQQGKLLALDGTPLDLDTNQPLFTWEGWQQADTTGQAVYYPTRFDTANHGGITKTQLLDRLRTSPFPGYSLELLPRNSSIPNQWNSGTRSNLAPGKSARDYLEALQANLEYAQESGQTLEGWITLFLAHLEANNQVIDDWQGNGKASWLLGSYHPSSGVVGYANWRRGVRRAGLNGSGPDYRDADFGLRPAVRMGQLEI